MGTGQTMLSLGALALLATSVISVNNSYTTTYQSVLQSKLGITAVSLASSFIEEASGKAFDQKTDDSVVTSTTGLTPANKLGLDPGESYPDSMTDFDDFNNLNLTRSFQEIVGSKPFGGGTFNVRCKVEYIDPNNPDAASATPTFHKKLTVTVTSGDMKDTVRTQFIFSYWYF